MPKKVDEKRVPKSLSWDARLFEAVNNIAVKGGYKSLSAFIEDLLIKNTDIVNEYIRLGKKKKK